MLDGRAGLGAGNALSRRSKWQDSVGVVSGCVANAALVLSAIAGMYLHGFSE